MNFYCELRAATSIARGSLTAKLVRVMKITAVLLLAAALQVAARSEGQTVTLAVKDAPVKEVFKAIQKQTGINVLVKESLLEKAGRVSLDVRNMPVAEVLNLCLKNLPLTYSFENNTVVIKPKAVSPPVTPSPVEAPPLVDVKGRLVDSSGQGIPGASVIVKSTPSLGTSTSSSGEFILRGVEENAVLVISGTNIITIEIAVNGRSDVGTIVVKNKIEQGSEVVIEANTGYQKVKPNEINGSIDFVDNKLLNRRVGLNILDRIENLTPGLIFDRNTGAPDKILIRGRSTIFADAKPLIIVDNFPYDGELDNINPNDIENITILKDAAAASIWGARAGNGVIVITTKKGKSGAPRVELNTTWTFQQRPDLFNVSSISSSDFIELEKQLFVQGFYSADELDPNHPPFTPVVELLIAKRDGLISAADADAQINSLKQFDVRDNLKNKFYQTALTQQHSLNVRGGSNSVTYYMSAGFDRNVPNIEGQTYNRITLRSQNTFNVTKRLSVDAGINFMQSISDIGNNPGYNYRSFAGKSFYPYAQLTSANGSSLPIYTTYRKPFTDLSKQKGFLNWEYRPFDEINNESNKIKLTDYLINTSIRYSILPGLNVEVKYQYENQKNSGTYLRSENSFFVRNIINNYTQVDPVTGMPRAVNPYPIPKGAIVDYSNSDIRSHQGRAQINYDRAIGSRGRLTAIGGFEIKNLVNISNGYRVYGYNPEYSTVSTSIDYVTSFPQYSRTGTTTIPNPVFASKMTDNFLSYYTNASYLYKNRYTVSMSLRKDEANLFGVKTNQKGTPLWSVGGGWELSKESFYKLTWLPFLKIRATYGHNGNISRLASAYTIATFRTAVNSSAVVADIKSPPNESLRWERTKMMNIGLDFATRNERISGSIEYYTKKATDLMGQAPLDPTLGLALQNGSSFFYGNVASMKVKGADFELKTVNINGNKFKWISHFVFGVYSSKVTEYLMPVSSQGSLYLNSVSNLNPIVGKPVYSMYSFRWAGLNPVNGNPMGYFNGQVSENYSSIYSSSPLNSMVYNGPMQPTKFGAFRNTLEYKQLSISFNISYKFGSYFRANSIRNAMSEWTEHGDYANRWQKPGDEARTSVPSFVYSNIAPNRMAFYQYADVLVDKADHIRFEDVSISYQLDKQTWKRCPFNSIRLYGYLSNLGTIWVANNRGIDPYFNNVPANGKSFSLGCNVSF